MRLMKDRTDRCSHQLALEFDRIGALGLRPFVVPYAVVPIDAEAKIDPGSGDLPQRWFRPGGKALRSEA